MTSNLSFQDHVYKTKDITKNILREILKYNKKVLFGYNILINNDNSGQGLVPYYIENNDDINELDKL